MGVYKHVSYIFIYIIKNQTAHLHCVFLNNFQLDICQHTFSSPLSGPSTTPALTLKLQEQGIRGLLRGGTHIGCLQLTDAWPGEVDRTSDKWSHIYTSVKPHFFTSF